ncbi:MAG TPA: DNA gyrase subunit A [Catalimonadaceae bacterium]|jgi:DNA gyrase subunit A|nr:DNA gyrase subunit A [Catalimonadaceae bacterium]
MAENENIIPINIEEEMRTAYIDYSMSVIVSRALPDVRDGLKPVHRRVLYAMDELGVNYNKPYKKSARIVGECLGKFHPHGDSSVYDAMVRMAQPWSLRYPLVDGQGNFGSIDGDEPAAMRYTEARTKRLTEELLNDLNKNTVNFQPNFDDSLEEPTVLPAKFPNLIVNGTSGIAVGMATNMAPHNLSEVIDGIHAYIDNRDISIADLCKFIKGPDFPTGGTIFGYNGIRLAMETGRGRIVIRANHRFETSKTGREQVIFYDIPYQVNKSTLIERIGEMVNEKILEGISDVRDESDRDGIRMVFDLKKDANSSVVVNTLYKLTALQSSFSVNNVCLVKGKPMTLNMKELIQYFVEHRHEIVVRRTQFDLNEAEKRAHILEGLLIALDNLDAVIKLIRESIDPEEARNGLMENFKMTEIQARAVLDMRLQRLTGLERDKIIEEYQEIQKLIARLKEILGDEGIRMGIIKDELAEIKERYGDARRTEIVMASDDLTMEDMISDDEMVITISHQGYIKRTPLTEYRVQSRGGVGSRATAVKDDDFTEHLFVATMHNHLLVFTNSGRMFWVKVYELPEGNKTAKGRPLQNIINIEKEDKVRAVINVKSLKDADYINNNYLVMCTVNGTIKKTTLEAFSRPRQAGIIAIGINEGDQLLDVKMTSGNDEIIIATYKGRAVRFPEEKVRPMGRGAAGVRGVSLAGDDDHVVGLVTIADKTRTLLVVSEKGYGKRTYFVDPEDGTDVYRVTNRGGKGVLTLNVTEKTGSVVGILDVTDKDELMIINKSGIMIRTSVSALRVMGRNTQGVRLIRLNEDDQISSIAKIEIEEEDVEVVEMENSSDILVDGSPEEPMNDSDQIDDSEGEAESENPENEN